MSTRTIAQLIASIALAATIGLAAPHAAASPALPAAFADDGDTAGIKKNAETFAAAWNKHDAKALAALWAKDGDLIDPWGVTSVGRANVEKFFAEQHGGSGKLGKSMCEFKSNNTRMITPDVALSDWQIVLTGLSSPEGAAMGPMIHHVAVIWKMDGGKWEIAAARPNLPTPMMSDGDSMSKPTTPPMTYEASATGSVTAKVTALDVDKRLITLQGPKGASEKFIVGPQVQRLNEVSVGDNVTISYTISLLGELRAPTPEEAAEPIEYYNVTTRTSGNADPAGGEGVAVKVVTTVDAIDAAKMLVTLKGPLGNKIAIHAKNKANVQKLHVGDSVIVTYTEGIALALDKTP